MRILFFSDNFPPETNAAANRVYERACYWVRWGHTVTVITCAPNFPEGKLYSGYKNRWYQRKSMDGITVIRIKTFIYPNKGRIRRTLDFLSYIPSAFFAGVIQERPDIVVATSPQFFVAVTGWLVAKVRKLPFIFELSDLWPASIVAVGIMRQNFFLRWIERLELFLYRQSVAVVALTESCRQNLIQRGISATKITVIMNGVDTSRYAPRKRDEALAKQWGLSGYFVIGYIGTHGMAHGLEDVLRVADALKEEKRIRFLFVGAGAARRDLLLLAKEMALSNVVFIPAQPKERMPSFWSLCDVALVHLRNTPLFQTVIPSKMFEAMAMGLPLLLAAPRGEASRIIEEERVGLWVPAGELTLLKKSILRFLNDAVFHGSCVRKSISTVPKYTRERQAKEMIILLESFVR